MVGIWIVCFKRMQARRLGGMTTSQMITLLTSMPSSETRNLRVYHSPTTASALIQTPANDAIVIATSVPPFVWDNETFKTITIVCAKNKADPKQ
jgi:hypothetical protein